MSTAAFAAVRRQLERAAVSYRVLEHPPVVTVEEARRLVPDLVARLATTVVFSVKDGGYVLVATRAGDRVGYRELASALSVNRRRLRLAGPEEVEAALGFEVGGVGPFPVAGVDEVIIDAGLAARERVVCGAGLRARSVDIAVADLVTVSQAAIAEVAVAGRDG